MSTNLIVVPLDETRSTDDQVVGSVVERGGKTYRWVKNAGTTANPKEAVCYKEPKTNGFTQITKPATANLMFAAGTPVVVMAENTFGWVQTKGPATLSVMASTSSSTQKGHPLIPVDGEVYWRGDITDATRELAVAHNFGIARSLQIVTSVDVPATGDKSAYLDCP